MAAITSAAAQARPVLTGRDLDRFIALPYALYRGDPGWAPLLRRDVRQMLDRGKNPFFDHAEAAYFVAERDGQVVGRIAAIENRLHNEFHQDRVGFYGFFECEEDPDAARALFDAAGGWLRQRGLSVMRGPASFSTNDEAGLLVEGFDAPAVLMMSYNPPYYARLVESAGFTKAKDLIGFQNTHHQLPERLVEGAAVLEKRYRVRTRTMDTRRFGQEVALVKRLYNACWERNWGFVPMTEREIDHLAAQLKPVVVPQLVTFAEREGETIGFAAALPDLNVALRANPTGRFFPGVLKVLWAARSISRVRVMLLGTLPEWRGKGVAALLYKRIWEEGTARGFYWAEAGWVLEDNHPMANGLLRMGFVPYKTYRLYDQPL